MSGSAIGLSAGGAKDINNFRENIKCGFIPQKTDITMEGIFYDYYFDTAADHHKQQSNYNSNSRLNDELENSLFYPSYSQGMYTVRILCIESLNH